MSVINTLTDRLTERILASVQRERLVESALEVVGLSSPTGFEMQMAEYLTTRLRKLGMQVMLQEVEDGRANALGILEGGANGPSLMFNGHLDTSYSGREPWLAGIAGFQPKGFVSGEHIYGLGISNMKGALCCYVEAVEALRESGVRLAGDLVIAGVVGEIEKAQWGDEFRGAAYRGYATGSRHLATFGGVADMCILGEPTEQTVVLGHYGTIWLRISTHGPFIHTGFSEGTLPQNSIVRMREILDAVLEWIPQWEERTTYGGSRGVVNVGAVRGGFPWRVSRTPQRTDLFLDVRVPPDLAMTSAVRDLKGWLKALRRRFPKHGLEHEIYVTAPGARVADDSPLIAALDESHRQVFGTLPAHRVARWFSDASALTRYGIETVNYGTSSGLPSATEGENLAIAGLVDTARVYALAAARICGVHA